MSRTSWIVHVAHHTDGTDTHIAALQVKGEQAMVLAICHIWFLHDHINIWGTQSHLEHKGSIRINSVVIMAERILEIDLLEMVKLCQAPNFTASASDDEQTEVIPTSASTLEYFH